MDAEFNKLPWHDAELININIDRAHAGSVDEVKILVRWPGHNKCSELVFYDCYACIARMNFGVVAAESILYAKYLTDSQKLLEIKERWKKLGVDLSDLSCYQIVTNVTNSEISIFASGFKEKN